MARNDGRRAPRVHGAAQRVLRKLLFAVALGATLPAAGAPTPAAKGPTPAELAARQADLGSLRSRIEALQREIAAAEASRREVADELRDSERAISDIRREQRRLAADRAASAAELRRLQAEARAAAGRLDTQQTRLGELLRRHYRDGDFDPLRLALSGRRPSAVARDRRLLGHIAAARAALIDDTRGTLIRTQSLAAAVTAEQQQLARLEDAQRARHADLRRQQIEHQRVMKRVAAQVRKQRRAVSTLQADARRLSTLVQKLTRLIEERRRAARAPQTRQRPAARAAPGRYADYDRSAAFARQLGELERPLAGTPPRRETQRKGVLFAAAPGAEVRAAAEGEVVFADWLRGFGNLLVIDHGEGFMSIYGNNEALFAQVGDQVAAGAVVATAGRSGGQRESGLYFELRFQGEAIDPLPWLRGG